MLNKILKFVKENKWLILISIIFFGILVYGAMNTMLASDDYPYSLYLRGGARVNSPVWIIKNQVSDYLNINSRMITNGLGQFLLMFDRPVFAIFNSLVVLGTIILVMYLINCYKPMDNKKKSIILLILSALFLGLDLMKYIIYWVMGAANYVWTMPLLLLFLCYHAKKGLFKHPILEAIYIGLVASFHESLLVFFIIFTIAHMIYDYYKERKISKKYIYYFIGLFLAGMFVFMSPGNIKRNNGWYPWWNEMSWIERLTKTIPMVASNMFKFDLILNIVPFVFTLIVLIRLISCKNKNAYLLAVSTLLTYILAIIFNNGWIYLIFSALLFFSEFYIHKKDNNLVLSVVSIGFYAIVYSMIITPEYAAGRPNYFMYIYMMFIIGLYIINLIKDRKNLLPLLILCVLLFGAYSAKEIKIYSVIGDIATKRSIAINNAKETNSKVLYLDPIPKGYTKYHMEPNTPMDKDYWAKKYFCTYYELDQNIEIRSK